MATHCKDCGNPDCHKVDTDPYWRRCPADRRLVHVAPRTYSTVTQTECAYCGRDVPAGDDAEPPNVADDDAWVELAAHHAEDCEWITTRAHRQ